MSVDDLDRYLSESLLYHAAAAADMLDGLGAGHTAGLLRNEIDKARAASALTEWQKNLLLLAADRYAAEVEALVVNAASIKTQGVLEQQLVQLRAARDWLDRRPIV